MANTTNYNWETPDDTDLVKDGAAAIRTLGSSIDTTTKALNPETTLGDIAYRSSTANTNTRLAIGSTGQVLTVVGGVPAWATSDDANAIQSAIVDAKGDIIAASAADTPARLAVGTDNQRLVAASGETTGLKYVSDTQNTVVDAEGDLLVGDSADTLQRLAIGSNTYVLTVDTSVDGKIKWAAPAGGSTFVGVKCYASASQTIANNTTTALTWDSETFDTDAFHSTSTNTSRITIPSGKAGYYQIVINTAWNTVNATGRRRFFIYKNGSSVQEFEGISSSVNYPANNYTVILNLAEGDYIESYVLQTSGGNMDTNAGSITSFIQAQFLGA